MTNRTIQFKQSVHETFPKNRNHILYIYDNFGEILFKNNWKQYKQGLNIDTSNQKIWTGVTGYGRILEDFTENERKECINFIFQHTLKELNI